jgi:hexosaminidase
LRGQGSYADEAVYSHADVARVVEYARVRAVRVMPEFEVPAHSGWGYGAPEVEGGSNKVFFVWRAEKP